MLEQPPSGRALLFAAALLFATSLSAQQAPVLSVYFASAADTLDMRAREQLDSLSRAAQNWGKYALELRAYTDDIGTPVQNIALSQRRAQAVSAYLGERAPQPSAKREQLMGELALSPKGDAAAQRAAARRVDLYAVRENPQTLSEFFELTAQREKQFFALADAKTASKFVGKKGTVLSIPAHAFERADGKKIALAMPISIELREAYSAGDMISQNLSTTSGGELLETGGSIYLEARDGGGNLLRLANGKAIDISMPQRSKTMPEGMQVFTAQRTGEQNSQAIDWQATNRPFAPMQRAEREGGYGRYYLSDEKGASVGGAKPLVTAHSIDNYHKTFDRMYPKQVVAFPKRFSATKPQEPTYLNPAFPNTAKIEQANPRQKGERKRAYRQRINKLFAEEQAQHTEALKKDRAARKEYMEQSRAYTKLLDEHIANCIAYKAYADSLTRSAEVVYRFMYGYTAYSSKENILPTEYSNLVTSIYRIVEMPKSVQGLSTLTIKGDMGADSSRAEFAQLRRMEDTLQIQVEKIRLACQNIQTGNILQRAEQLEKTILAERDYLKPLLQEFLKSPVTLNDKNFQGAEIDSNALAGVTKLEQFFAQYGTQFREGKSFHEIEALHKELVDAGIDKAMQNLSQLNARISQLNKLYKLKKVELNELTDEEQLSVIASTTQMGWINCDRFLGIPANECMHFTIDYMREPNTQFFVVLPQANSIIALAPDAEGKYACQQYNGLPKTHRAKLVGLRIQDGKFAMTVYESTVEKLPAARINLRECSREQAMKAFAAL